MAQANDSGGGGGGFSVDPQILVSKSSAIYRQAATATRSIAADLSALKGQGSQAVMGPGDAADAFADFCRFWQNEYQDVSEDLKTCEQLFRDSAHSYQRTDEAEASSYK